MELTANLQEIKDRAATLAMKPKCELGPDIAALAAIIVDLVDEITSSPERNP